MIIIRVDNKSRLAPPTTYLQNWGLPYHTCGFIGIKKVSMSVLDGCTEPLHHPGRLEVPG
jgi:hypothetical protein